MVTAQAAAKWLEALEKVEALDNLDQLLSRHRRPQPVAKNHCVPFEEASIPRQKNPSFSTGDVRQLAIAAVVPIQRIEAGQAQVGGEPPQVCVQHETRLIDGPWPDPRERRDVDRFENRIHADPIPIFHDVGNVDRAASDQDEVDFRVGNAECLDEVLHRLSTLKALEKRTPSLVPGEEVAERSVESEGGLFHVFPVSLTMWDGV